ncbi:MAG: DNA gyrase C-terminal beta-propeller domain-containing protein, partial [Patescibacteria group bacterium]
GKSIKFKEEDVRPTARDTMGVRGIDLKNDDSVVGMEVTAPKSDIEILIVTEMGLGKRTAVGEWPLQNRGGQGVKAAEVTTKTGKIVSCMAVGNHIGQIIITSKSAQVIRTDLKSVPKLGRATQGVILMRFSEKNDNVAAVAVLEKNDQD